MLSKKILVINDVGQYLGYISTKGTLFIYYKDGSIGNVKNCRVEFSWSFREQHKRIGFSRPNLDINLFNEFFEKIENKLNLKIKSVFYKTDKEDTIIIKLAPFWLQNDTRRSLLTLLMRCVSIYKGNLDETLENDVLAQHVLLAINYFLNGFTVPTYGDMNKKDCQGYFGFVTQFKNVSEKQLKTMLVKDEKNA